MSSHPSGARGGNGGLQDVDALGWRLAAVLDGRADAGILRAYDRERCFGADENLLNSSRTTRFMSPAPGAERLYRDAVLVLAGRVDFARAMANSGRLSRPCVYPLADAPDAADLPAPARPGAVAADAPLAGGGWLLDQLGREPVLLALGMPAPAGLAIRVLATPLTPEIRARYLGSAERALYLIRPDQVVVARWTSASEAEIATALRRLWEDVE